MIMSRVSPNVSVRTFARKDSTQLTHPSGTYQQTTMPVIHYYEQLGRVAKVSAVSLSYGQFLTFSQIEASNSVDDVYAETRKAVEKALQ